MRRVKARIKILKHQRRLVESTAMYPALVGGYGSGKSGALIFRAMHLKLKYLKNDIGYYLPTYDLVRRIAFPRFEAFLREYKIPYRTNKLENTIRVKGEGHIVFRTMDRPEKIVGYEVADSFVDELDVLPTDKAEEAWNKIVARNRQPKPDKSKNTAAVGTTPEGYRFVYKKWHDNPNPEYELIRASTYDNIYLPKDYIKSLYEQFDSHLLRAYINGEFVNLQTGNVYVFFDRAVHDTQETIAEGETLHVGQDFNVGGCVSTIHVVRNGIPMQLDEMESRDTFAIIRNLKSRYPNHRIIIYPDASGANRSSAAAKTDIALLAEAGFEINAPKQNPRITDRVNSVNALMERGMYKINTRMCPKTTEAWEQQAYDKRTGMPEKFAGAGTIDDYTDSAGYFLHRAFGITRHEFSVEEWSVFG